MRNLRDAKWGVLKAKFKYSKEESIIKNLFTFPLVRGFTPIMELYYTYNRPFYGRDSMKTSIIDDVWFLYLS